ncbi:MAG TPA: Flp pilus assembly protein CpaB [Candidatus Dormibacteraeota bacterium]|nr:Flp pilus assembly protein CpaB [Candidatus Dormibacteraeota bacterium]HEV2475388.1 Flp pilus assembly protein CpaB [Candidatus Dormibacteraeota bacterium]
MAAIGQTRPAPPASGVRTPIFVLGIALALGAFLLMFTFGLIFAGRIQTGGTTQVVVAQQAIDPRTPITADMLTVSAIPNSAVPPRTFLRVADLTGYFAVVAIYKGEPITGNLVSQNPDLINPSSGTAYLPIPQGYVAMTIPTGELQGVGGFPAQGDYIDVIATVNTGQFASASPRTVVLTVFKNLYILRVGPQSVVPRQGQPQGVASSLTVLMTICDAQYLDWLLVNTTLKYALVSYKDYGTAPTGPDPSCPSTSSPALIGPTEVQARWDFARP